MSRGLIYRVIFILVLITFAVILILPTVGEKTMKIELSENVTQQQLQRISERFSSDDFQVEQKDNAILVSGINLSDAVMNEVRIFPGVIDAKLLPHWAESAVLAKKINLGLDLQGGMHLVLQADFEQMEKKLGKTISEKEKTELSRQALELLRNRVDKFGVSEPSIRPRGNDAIEIQLPGVKNPKSVKKAIGTTGRVEYRLGNDKYTQEANQWVNENLEGGTLPDDQAELRRLEEKIADGIGLPDNLLILFYYERDDQTNKLYPSYPIVLQKDIALAGDDINKAWVAPDEYQQLAVHFTLTTDGAAKFAEVTSEKNQGKKLAIVIDEKVRSAPVIRVQISTGQAIIQGDFTREEVHALARIIKEGALPVDLSIIEERTVGPSLGQDSIESGVKAIVVGLLGVMFFMMLYYKFSGLISDIGLIINIILMMALLSWLGFTLTLPGFAGFILTVGMAVDANVIIYERIKEELKSGKSARMAVANGFDRAFWTIFDANLTTLIAAFVLSQFGTGPIKGFAVTLFIGVLCSMFVALYITKTIFEIITSSRKIKKLSI